MSIPRYLISKLEEVIWGDKDVRRSPLRHLLKSNAIPSDSEEIAIRAVITDAEACIEELHSRFPARDRASQVMESQLLKINETHRALLSPVRYLPTEILQEIFLHYADNPSPNTAITKMPWRLGHISYRWREVALSFPPLWDNIPKIYISAAKSDRLYDRALIYLIQRSGTSPTLKFDISGHPLPSLGMVPESPLIKEIMLHSERIEQLRFEVSKTTMPLFQGFKGRLPNLRILRLFLQVNLNANELPNFDVFEFAPALRQVAVGGSYRDSSVRILLPWSQITHFEEQLPAERVGQLEPLSSLHSLTHLDIDKRRSFEKFAVLSPYRPTTLPNLHTLRVLIHDRDYKNVDLFLKSLTIPAVEVMKIFCMGPLIPRLVSMLSASGSHGPSRLQKLAFRTTPLRTGELSTLLELTPHLVELDIDVPPADDLLSLVYGVGEVMLVPMLQVLYMHSPGVLTAAQTEHFDTLAQFRCESGCHKDSEDTTMPSLGSGTQTTLHTLRILFDSAESRDSSQKTLNKWSSSFTLEEVKAISMISRCSNYINGICGKSFENNAILSNLDQLLAYIEHYEVTNKVLHVGIFFACGIFTANIIILFFRRQIYTFSFYIVSLGSSWFYQIKVHIN